MRGGIEPKWEVSWLHTITSAQLGYKIVIKTHPTSRNEDFPPPPASPPVPPHPRPKKPQCLVSLLLFFFPQHLCTPSTLRAVGPSAQAQRQRRR